MCKEENKRELDTKGNNIHTKEPNIISHGYLNPKLIKYREYKQIRREERTSKSSNNQQTLKSLARCMDMF